MNNFKNSTFFSFLYFSDKDVFDREIHLLLCFRLATLENLATKILAIERADEMQQTLITCLNKMADIRAGLSSSLAVGRDVRRMLREAMRQVLREAPDSDLVRAVRDDREAPPDREVGEVEEVREGAAEGGSVPADPADPVDPVVPKVMDPAAELDTWTKLSEVD